MKVYGLDGKPIQGDPDNDIRDEQRDEDRRDDGSPQSGDVLDAVLGGDE